jgi:CheY-like chemotaxis protein
MPTSVVPPLLVAEDDANDMFLFTRLLNAAGAANALHIALDGREAIRLLTPIVEKSRLAPRPAAAFLDAKMPHLSGLDVLEWIRRQPELDGMPVVLMSKEPNPQDVTRAAELGAQCYLSKFPGKLTMARLLDHASRFTAHDGDHLFDIPDNLIRKKVGKDPL